jgi:uncharacterized membrane protein
MVLAWTTVFWIFPLLCLIFMVLMMFGRMSCGHSPFGRRDRAQTSSGSETPRQILDRRYVSGQITKEQYKAMRSDVNE